MRFLRPMVVVLFVGCLAACSLGSPRRQITLTAASPIGPAQSGGVLEPGDTLPAVADDAVPRPAVAKLCFADQGDLDGLLAVIRPGVGTVLALEVWSGGRSTQTTPNGAENAGPPSSETIALPLRLVASDGELDAAEQALLAAALTTNRRNWGDAVEFPDETFFKKASKSLHAHRALLWNALVRGMCIEIRGDSDEPPRFLVQFDMARLCRALPDGDSAQLSFRKLFFGPKVSACPTTPELRSILGIDRTAFATSATQAALNAAPSLARSMYYDSVANLVSLGALHVEGATMRGDGAPSWTLAEWEASGICRFTDGSPAQIRRVRLRGGHGRLTVARLEGHKPTLSVRRVLTATGVETEIVENGGEPGWWRRLIDPRDLDRLHPIDVDRLEWAREDGTSRSSDVIVPAGCRIP